MRGKKILNFSIIAISFTVLMFAFVAVTPSVFAAHCTTTVTASSSIRTAVDAASSGDVVCLDDSGGVFSQSVVFSGTAGSDDDSGITLAAVHGSSPILDGTVGSLVNAIELRDGVSDITIQDLEIRDYSNIAIDGDGTIGTPLSSIRLKSLDIHDIGFHAIDIIHSEDVVITDSTIAKASGFDFTFDEAIRLQSVDGFVVKDVDVDGGFIGVNFACAPCPDPGGPSNGLVKDSIFANNFIGVLIAHSTDAHVKDNKITDALFGIRIGFGGVTVTGAKIMQNELTENIVGIFAAAAPGPTVDVFIKANSVFDNVSDGILLLDTDDSKIFDNVVTNNGGNGIGFLFGSTGNMIKGNTASGNPTGSGFTFISGTADMFHDGSSSPNTWKKNTCGTSLGGDIDCP